MSVRVGQMTGAVSGAWNAQEWFPSLLKSSIYLGFIPTLDKVCPPLALLISGYMVLHAISIRLSPGFRSTQLRLPSSRCARPSLPLFILRMQGQLPGVQWLSRSLLSSSSRRPPTTTG